MVLNGSGSRHDVLAVCCNRRCLGDDCVRVGPMKRGTVVKVEMVGIVQNVLFDGEGVRITVDPVDPSGIWKTKGARWWAVVPVVACKELGR